MLPQIAAIFLCCAAAYNHLVKPGNIQWFQALYYLSSFFGLFGSHTTSFLLSGALPLQCTHAWHCVPVHVRMCVHDLGSCLA